jgi:hypothetical protein
MIKETPDSPPLETSVGVVLASDELPSVVGEYLEIGIDAIMEEGLAKEIPLVSTVVAGYRVVGRIRDRMFLKKLLDFLSPLRAIPAVERKEMVRKLEADANYGRKVGEHLLDLLDRISAHRKPAMLSRVFLAHSRGEVDAEMLHRLFHAVEQMPAFEIPMLRKQAEGDPHPPTRASNFNLAHAGLLHVVYGPLGGPAGYSLSDTGDTFLQLELDRLS